MDTADALKKQITKYLVRFAMNGFLVGSIVGGAITAYFLYFK